MSDCDNIWRLVNLTVTWASWKSMEDFSEFTSFGVRFWQKVAVFFPKYNHSTNTQMISTYDVETWVVIFWCVEFNFHNVKWLMEWHVHDLENFSKNVMACPKRLLSLICIQWHHLKVYGIWLMYPHVSK